MDNLTWSYTCCIKIVFLRIFYCLQSMVYCDIQYSIYNICIISYFTVHLQSMYHSINNVRFWRKSYKVISGCNGKKGPKYLFHFFSRCLAFKTIKWNHPRAHIFHFLFSIREKRPIRQEKTKKIKYLFGFFGTSKFLDVWSNN